MTGRKTFTTSHQETAHNESHAEKDIISTTKKISVSINLVATYSKISVMYSK